MRRLKACVERWPGCESGLYDPRCCRFPKSCSCESYDAERVEESDLEPAVDPLCPTGECVGECNPESHGI